LKAGLVKTDGQKKKQTNGGPIERTIGLKSPTRWSQAEKKTKVEGAAPLRDKIHAKDKKIREGSWVGGQSLEVEGASDAVYQGHG